MVHVLEARISEFLGVLSRVFSMNTSPGKTASLSKVMGREVYLNIRCIKEQ